MGPGKMLSFTHALQRTAARKWAPILVLIALIIVVLRTSLLTDLQMKGGLQENLSRLIYSWH
jgi:hypothetical protein